MSTESPSKRAAAWRARLDELLGESLPGYREALLAEIGRAVEVIGDDRRLLHHLDVFASTRPVDEIDGRIAVQLAALHVLAMDRFARGAADYSGPYAEAPWALANSGAGLRCLAAFRGHVIAVARRHAKRGLASAPFLNAQAWQSLMQAACAAAVDAPSEFAAADEAKAEHDAQRSTDGATMGPSAVAAMLSSPRCGARTRAGHACRAPAMANGRCRRHGGTSTGPRTAAGRERCRQARLKHGHFAAEAIAERQRLAAYLRHCRHWREIALMAVRAPTTNFAEGPHVKKGREAAAFVENANHAAAGSSAANFAEGPHVKAAPSHTEKEARRHEKKAVIPAL